MLAAAELREAAPVQGPVAQVTSNACSACKLATQVLEGLSRLHRCTSSWNPFYHNFPEQPAVAGYTHTATLTKLKPSTQYYYIFGDALYEFSGERSFRTAPAVGSNATLHVLVNADMVRPTCLRPLSMRGSQPCLAMSTDFLS